jgi:signal transduction histidine kinase
LQRLATAHTDPAKEEWAREISRRYPPSLDQGAGHIIRSGECSLVPEVTDEMLQSAVRDEEHLEILRGLGVRSAMSVPLTARNRTFGVMTFLISDSRRRFGPDDLTLAEDLGRRAALAVDNARLFREAEQARAEAETQRAHLHRLFMQAPAIVAVTRGPDHIFELANQRFVELLGDRNFIGRSYHDAIPEVEGQGLFAVVDAVFQSGQPFAGNEMPVQLRRGDTEELTTGYFNFVVQPVIEADGSIGGVMMHGVGVTEQVEARQEVERLAAERQQVLGEKDEFLSAAAHDLKSPLAAIKGTTQLVARRLESGNASQPADILPYLARIEATANRMNGLVNDLLDVTRIQMDQPFELEVEPTDLVALVREVVVDYQASVHRHRLVFEADESEIVGSWDAPRLARAVGNIVANAIRFSPEGGEVTARVGRNGSHAIVSVQDQGLGIPEADLPHIFERFYRGGNVMGRISGTGIGLAGSRRIVDQHGGSIDVESQEGKGSTFTIRLPL